MNSGAKHSNKEKLGIFAVAATAEKLELIQIGSWASILAGLV